MYYGTSTCTVRFALTFQSCTVHWCILGVCRELPPPPWAGHPSEAKWRDRGTCSDQGTPETDDDSRIQPSSLEGSPSNQGTWPGDELYAHQWHLRERERERERENISSNHWKVVMELYWTYLVVCSHLAWYIWCKTALLTSKSPSVDRG